MAQHLTSREIASRLGISAHTIKHHIGNILGKLAVGDRRQAVARARTLGLLK
jgi:LuxR family maltose regulon positive regulatory protein